MGQRIVVMKDGKMQQVADPIRLYDQPVNRFVAGFIGTPQMNFFEGHISGNGEAMTWEGPGGLSVAVPAHMRPALTPLAGQPVTFGVRPEDIGSTMAEQLVGAPRLRAVVEVVEPMGSESYVHLRIGDTTFISRVDAHRKFSVGETAEPAVFIDKAHFFNPKTEQCIV